MLKNIGIFILLVGVNFLFKNIAGENYLVNRNTVEMKKFLSGNRKRTEISQTGTVKDIFLLDYDTVYVFSTEDTIEDMINRTNIESKRFEESESEDIVNILFAYEGRESVYLYGHPRDIGCYLELEPGKYFKKDIEDLDYIREQKKLTIPNKRGRQKYINYKILIDETSKKDELNEKDEMKTP